MSICITMYKATQNKQEMGDNTLKYINGVNECKGSLKSHNQPYTFNLHNNKLT